MNNVVDIFALNICKTSLLYNILVINCIKIINISSAYTTKLFKILEIFRNKVSLDKMYLLV